LSSRAREQIGTASGSTSRLVPSCRCLLYHVPARWKSLLAALLCLGPSSFFTSSAATIMILSSASLSSHSDHRPAQMTPDAYHAMGLFDAARVSRCFFTSLQQSFSVVGRAVGAERVRFQPACHPELFAGGSSNADAHGFLIEHPNLSTMDSFMVRPLITISLDLQSLFWS